MRLAIQIAREIVRSVLLRLLRKTRPPYECYWKDRAQRAEKKVKQLTGELEDAQEALKLLASNGLH